MKIALTNVLFNNTYNNVVRFASKEAQGAFFKLNELFNGTEKEVNVDIGNLINTVAVVKMNVLNYKAFNYNYAIIKDENNNYYYYFITLISYDSASQVLLSLELDVFQTYHIGIEFSNSLIYRAHKNRYIRDGLNLLNNNAGYMYTSDNQINIPQILSKRKKIKFRWAENKDAVNDWLYDNVSGWRYVFMDAEKEGLSETIYDTDGVSGIGLGYGIYAEPLYKRNKSIYIVNAGEKRRLSALDGFITNKAYVYNMKLQYMPPQYLFELSDFQASYTFDENDNLIINLKTGTTTGVAFNDVGLDSAVVFQSLYNPNKTYESIPYTMNEDHVFTDNFINKPYNYKLEPKIKNEHFKYIKIINNGSEFIYDAQKVFDNQNANLVFLYTEILTPTISKSYLRLKSVNTTYYNESTTSNFMGAVASYDASVPYAVTGFENFIANNKNFWQQQNNKINMDSANSVLGTMATLGSGDLTGALTSSITNIGNTWNAIQNVNWQVDNVKSSPSSLVNANGDVLFNYGVTDNGLYFEIWDASEYEKRKYSKYLYLFGYRIEEFDDLDITKPNREYFNFYQAQIEFITHKTLELNELVKSKFREIFANGVRVWEDTPELFKFNLENYERSFKIE